MAASSPRSPLGRLTTLLVARPVLVVGLWLVVAAGLNVAVPQLESVVKHDSTPVVPASAGASQTFTAMDRAFGNGKSESFVFIVLERRSGLTHTDRLYYRHLIASLRNADEVSFVQDLTKNKALLASVTSRDKQAVYLTVGLPGATGAPSASHQIAQVRDILGRDRPAGLEAAVTGPGATITDMFEETERSVALITVITVGIIALLLLVIYRSIVITVLALSVIGISLAVARAVTAWFGLHVFAVSTFTGSFLTAVVLGAGTDYVVFLISRFHEQRRLGADPLAAVWRASTSVGSVIVGSAATVVVANACMLFADVGLFRTTGPAIAVSVVTTLAIALTLTPAALAVLGPRGLVDPRARHDDARWARVASLVTRHPGRVMAAGLTPLIALAALYPLLQVSFDEREVQPASTDSNAGYAMLSRHFPINEVLPDYVLVTADHDMRNPKDLAALENAAAEASRQPGVLSVRGVTRPNGTTIKEASLGHQSGVVGDKLTTAGRKVSAGSADAQRLGAGASQAADGAKRVSAGAGQAVDGSGELLAGVDRLSAGLDALKEGSASARGGGARLQAGARELATGLDEARARTQEAVDGLALVQDALRKSLVCGLDPYCRGARDGIQKIYEGERDQLVPGLTRAAAAAHQIADGTGDLDAGLGRLEDGLAQAQSGSRELRDGQALMRKKLGELEAGSKKLAAGAGQVRDGAKAVPTSLKKLESGLDQAATYLKTVRRDASDPAIGGFYLPAAAWKDERLALSSKLFLSEDGRTARLIVLGKEQAFGHTAIVRTADVRSAIDTALQGTDLERADVGITGLSAIMAELRTLSHDDFLAVAAAALLAVLLILVWLLRSVVAGVFLVATVVLSYLAAVGLGILVWQIVLDQPLDWSVPTIAFILLVAVGADYNLLLVKRVREEADAGHADAVARAVVSTGGVITTAGIIFAASMMALMFGSVTILTQIGFTVGVGLLIDTFLVRSLVVPAGSVLLGDRLWWPGRPPHLPS